MSVFDNYHPSLGPLYYDDFFAYDGNDPFPDDSVYDEPFTPWLDDVYGDEYFDIDEMEERANAHIDALFAVQEKSSAARGHKRALMESPRYLLHRNRHREDRRCKDISWKRHRRTRWRRIKSDFILSN